MERNSFISRMTNNTHRIHALVTGISEEQARWKPGPDSWSILEVINHLRDVEQEDFRVFLDLILHRPDDPRPKISPQAWVTERKYNEQDPGESLQGFVSAREASVAWLQGLSLDWTKTYKAPWGPMKAGDICAAWVAHDLLHMRQLVELHWAYTVRQMKPYSTEYAGDWSEE
jgi:hypothetical protein